MPRINDHPVLGPRQRRPEVQIFVDGLPFLAEEGEPIAAALWANDHRVLRWSPKLGEPRGIFCAIGRCTDCVMTVDGQPNVRTCITPVRVGMQIETQHGMGEMPTKLLENLSKKSVVVFESEIEVAIVGAGPAGLAAAITLAELGIACLLIDENAEPGGQLVKQLHRFFGSKEHGAGVRGYILAEQMVQQAQELGVKILPNTAVFGIHPGPLLGVYSPDFGVRHIQADRIIITPGASERGLPFKNWTLPGVMGAGAAQTLMNLHRVMPGHKAFIIGSGNVGLIVAWQMLQVGIDVAAIIEAQPQIGGYEVHAARVKRQGVPILTRHTILRALGEQSVTGAEICKLDDSFQPVAGSEEIIDCDLICLAVGLTPQIELAQMTGCNLTYEPRLGGHIATSEMHDNLSQNIFTAGDVAGVEEASIAIEEGRLAALKCARSLGRVSAELVDNNLVTVQKRLDTLRQPVNVNEITSVENSTISTDKIYQKTVAVIECPQPIPCNPCETSCPVGAIRVGEDIWACPTIDIEKCTGCGRCVTVCPGMAIFLLGPGPEIETVAVTIPYELPEIPEAGQTLAGLDRLGKMVCEVKIIAVRNLNSPGDTGLMTLLVPAEFAKEVRAFKYL